MKLNRLNQFSATPVAGSVTMDKLISLSFIQVFLKCGMSFMGLLRRLNEMIHFITRIGGIHSLNNCF